MNQNLCDLRRDAVKKAAATKKATESKEAREQSLADDTESDADSDFQVDGGNPKTYTLNPKP